MFVTTGLVALTRKLSDDKARKKEAKLSDLQVGDTDVARQAFIPQASTLDLQASSITRTGTEIKWETAGDINPEAASLSSPVSPESTRSPRSTPTESDRQPTSPHSEQLPPYSPTMESSHSVVSKRPRHSISPSSADPSGYSSSTIRVKTSGSDLSSGFSYHASLFDLRVRPDEWMRFSSEICSATKLTGVENAKLWASATTVALTGAIVTSVWLGRNMKRVMQESKVRAGLADMGEGGLGDILQIWNEDYFGKLGLAVRLELSEEAVRHGGASKTVRKHALLYSSREERERKREERKFVLVVSPLQASLVQQPSEVTELPASDKATEMPVPSDARAFTTELPGSKGSKHAELPASSAHDNLKDSSGLFELPAELPASLKDMTTKDRNSNQ